METSIFLAKVIGLVSVISTLAVLIRYKTFLKIEEEAVKCPILVHLSGFCFLIIGVLLVVSHQIQTDICHVTTLDTNQMLVGVRFRGIHEPLSSAVQR